ncbi:MAG TPA: SCO family protein [Chloroflexi bacterium]|nr:SCO family protein [Chloroflexota bacterium]
MVGLIVGLGSIALVALPRLRPYQFHGTVLQSPQPAPDFELEAAHGQKVSLKNFQGKLVLLYFGYTFCPDVCPATLSELAKALDILGSQAQDVQVIMISVDPGRDTPEMLAEYVAHFDPSFLGVTGTPEEIAQTAALYGIFYEAHEGTAATGYLVDHTATVMVIDQKGHLKLIFPFGMPAEEIAADLAYLLK